MFRVLAVLLALASLAGCELETTHEAEVVKTKPTVIVDARTLCARYEANEVAADAAYKNRVVQVTGVITSIAKDIVDTPYIVLSDGNPMGIGGVQCTFSDAHLGALAQMNKGDRITLKGKCRGRIMLNVLLRGCTGTDEPKAAERKKRPVTAAPTDDPDEESIPDIPPATVVDDPPAPVVDDPAPTEPAIDLKSLKKGEVVTVEMFDGTTYKGAVFSSSSRHITVTVDGKMHGFKPSEIKAVTR